VIDRKIRKVCGYGRGPIEDVPPISAQSQGRMTVDRGNGLCSEGRSLNFSFQRVVVIQDGLRRRKIEKGEEKGHEKIVITL